MAKGRHYSAYQQGIIRRYYENRDDLMAQKLGEIVSELYLAQGDAKKAERLWKRAQQALEKTPAQPARVARVLESRDLAKLAELVGEVAFGDDTRPAPRKKR